ncbi:pyruvate kinase [Microlunatus phosphovorus NM-1]|uniref:Pyruvate kinase n=1 Tax=Microlunatus phosphovorus (strain ATCC 700054 / DSM 10555 / JCM 9379 / NBRC 101784 / NCIMB 13414 / VKM Ac-1990 / NM-1) TaxID=1032480 RepID=F5XRR6_MICPN|nr:pyruvate kinase [Microlunatus phosphovorus]BAK37129.1 pyruvate kinase [Microlunatus phosphovorus NM-1]
MRRANIVCTLGPASESPERLVELVEAGMDVARLNMSHGDYAEHRKRLEAVREAARLAGRPVGVLVDLQGPKIRLGRFAAGKEVLVPGAQFTITIDDIPGTVDRCSTTFKGLPGDVAPGDTILIDDGRLQLEAISVTDTDVVTRVVVGGEVSNNKGINLPGVAVSVPAMSEKDISDLRWGLRNGADMVALSFVRNAEDVKLVHQVMDEEGRRVPVIAKMEKPQAIENLDEIIDAFDAFMVARGDLGVELPLEEVPLVQKRIVTAARRWAKPVIVATQMLESMISAPRPTRAETSDVANAILDGADAVMLSGETSVGAYPVLTVQTMARIVANTEAHGQDQLTNIDWDPHTTSGVITKAAAEIGERVNAKFLVAFTHSGDAARRLSRLRSPIPILAFTPIEATQAALTLAWGVDTVLVPMVSHTDDMIRQVDKALTENGFISEGERVVIIAGSPPGVAGHTNMIRVRRIGSPL